MINLALSFYCDIGEKYHNYSVHASSLGGGERLRRIVIDVWMCTGEPELGASYTVAKAILFLNFIEFNLFLFIYLCF